MDQTPDAPAESIDEAPQRPRRWYKKWWFFLCVYLLAPGPLGALADFMPVPIENALAAIFAPILWGAMYIPPVLLFYDWYLPLWY